MRIHGLLGLGAVLVGCAGASAQPSGPADPSSVVAIPPSAAASAPDAAASASPVSTSPPADTSDAGAVASSVPDESDAGPKACGCALCEPVVSEDACKTDADCAPDLPCHAPRCVAKSKAQPRRPGQMCTMLMACTTADANACSCVKNRCTLHARDEKPAPKK
jgi:hypothetical protein